MIPFNRQNLFGNEMEYIKKTFENGKISGDGEFTRKCNSFLEKRFKAGRVMLTTSCTHALEMAAILCNIQPGDQVIMPSYTFVSTVNAFVLRGAKPVFCDIKRKDLNMDEELLPDLVTEKTKAIVPVHYAGVGCEMDHIMEIARKEGLFVVEDAAQAVDSLYKDRYLGTIGDIGCFSFHETKNFSSGEGGAILINNPDLVERAEIIREKGTNRSKFFRGEVDKYTWVDVGSSYLPSEINAAVLYAQLENIDAINESRKRIHERYRCGLEDLEEKDLLELPHSIDDGKCNHHMFQIILPTNDIRDGLMYHLKKCGISSVFHYIPLHSSDFYRKNFGEVSLPVTEDLSQRLLRLPIYYSLSDEEIDKVVLSIRTYLDECNK